MSKPEPSFDMDDLVQEILSTEREGQLGWRVQELVEATGLTVRMVRLRLRRLLEVGRLERGKRRIEDLSGRTTLVPVYRLKADGE